MKILLVNPPFNRLKRIYHPYFPLGLGYLASVLIQQGYEVKIYNGDGPDKKITRKSPLLWQKFAGQDSYIKILADECHEIWREAADVIASFSPDIVGITSTSPVYPAAKKIARLVKKVRVNACVVMGGAHPTLQPNEVLNDTDVDFVVRGEGENTLLELVAALKPGSADFSCKNIKGLAFKKNGTIFINEDRELINDLDSLPYPARDVLINPWASNDDKKMILASRGCPFECAYCNSKDLWQRKYRIRSTENIISEMIYLYNRYRVRLFEFRDEIFLLPKQRMVEFCDSLQVHKYNFRWSCDTRVDCIDRNEIINMAQAGCVFISLGLESGCKDSLRKLNKKLSPEDALGKCSVIKKMGIMLNINMMIGLPWETRKDLMNTARFIEEIKPNKVFIGTYTPLPGTDLNQGEYRVDIKDDEWKYYSFHSNHNFFIKTGMGKKEFDSLRDKIIKVSDKYNRDTWREHIMALKRKLIFLKTFPVCCLSQQSE